MASRLQQISNAFKMAPKLNENGIPSFDSLPLREGDPHHSAWGLYGDDDELGTLNRLTDERVAAAAKNEIKKGIRYVFRPISKYTAKAPPPPQPSWAWD